MQNGRHRRSSWGAAKGQIDWCLFPVTYESSTNSHDLMHFPISTYILLYSVPLDVTFHG